MNVRRLIFFVFFIPLAAALSPAADFDFFEKKIRPVLIESCYECHSVDGGKAKGSLLLDTAEGMRKGGDNGPAVVPGEPGQSLLIAAITHEQPDLEMPPKQERLPSSVIAHFRKWIEDGASDPRTESTGKISDAPTDIESGREFWAFVPPKPVSPPELNPAPITNVDRFIRKRLADAGLRPSPEASPATLLRRIHFDLTGLPPTQTEQKSFHHSVKGDGLAVALENRVDQLLSRPAFGEKWGRHWLDVARFAESSGKESNFTYPEAWRYRDYVIDAFNADLPFDQFVTEQLAGDLLPTENDQERARLLIATGYLAVGPTSLNEMNLDQFHADVADEQINASTQGFMAITVACARCHDHKFDPVSMRDYYALAGIFRSTKTHVGTAVGPDNQIGGELIHLPESTKLPTFYKAMTPEAVQKLKQEKKDLIAKNDAAVARAEKARQEGRDPTGEYSLQMAIGHIWRVGGIDGKLALVDEKGQPNVMCMGVLDDKQIRDLPVYERGELAHPGKEKIPRGFPEVIALTDAPQVPDGKSGRLQYARWLTHPEHPLTSRVIANRIWKHLFRTGIVRTTDNFGYNGERPSHPELLDYLALRLMNEYEWSLKKLIRELVLTDTYRQSSDYRESAFLEDPENRLLWRMSKRRLDAEEIRDAMLAVSHDLDSRRPVASLIGRTGNRNAALIHFARDIPSDLDGSTHRSVYLPVLRDKLPDILELFDFAESSLVTGHRESTNVPMQALYFMNSEFVEARAASLAELARSNSPDGDLVSAAFRACLSRSPSPEEKKLGEEFFRNTESTSDQEDSLKRYCQALISTAQFRNLD